MVDIQRRIGAKRHLRRKALAACGVALALTLSACASTESSNAPTVGSGKVEGDGGEIVFFSVTTSNPYIAQQVKSAEAEAERLNYKLKVVTNNFDAGQLQQQIQQQIASGQKPKAFILFALDQKAAVNQARQLANVAPVFQINQNVADEGFEYVKSYVGPSDVLIGETAGQTLMALRDKLASQGTALHSPEGNLLAISAEPGLQTTRDRWAGLTDATKDKPFNVLQNQDCCSDPEKAYQMASQLIPKYKDQLDFVFAQNVDAGGGVVQALKENGLEPGKNVWVVVGNCGGPKRLITSGDIYGAGAQLASVEGNAMVQTIAQYLATGEVEDGTSYLEYTKDVPEVPLSAPKKLNYLSNPSITAESNLSDIVWGATIESSCPMS